MSANQYEISGVKPYLNPWANSLSLTDASNQILLMPVSSGVTGTSIALNAVSPANNLVYTIPDVGSNSFFQLSNSRTAGISASTVLNSAGSGYLYYINSSASSVAITLPAVGQTGMNFEFIVAGSLSNAVTIGAGSAIIQGTLVGQTGTGGVGEGSYLNGVSNVIIGTTAKLGDRHRFRSNSVKWFYEGVSGLTSSITSS